MKNRGIFILIGVFALIGFTGCFSSKLPATDKIGEDLYVEKIQENVYIVNHEFPWPANSMVVQMENEDIVLVDTPYTPEATEVLLNWVNQSFDDPKIYAINTGFHFDNLGGNEVLVKKGILIYGSSLTESTIAKLGERSRELFLSWLNKPESKRFYDAYQQIPYIPPTKVFDFTKSDLYSIKFGKEEVELYYPGETHSPDNLVVYFPKKDILFGGCMVKSMEAKDLGNIADANLKEWPISLRRLLKKYSNVKTVVPGHDTWGNTDLIRHTIDLCKENN